MLRNILKFLAQNFSQNGTDVFEYGDKSDVLLFGLVIVFCIGMTLVFWPGVGTWEVIQFALQKNLLLMNDWKSVFVAKIYWFFDNMNAGTGPILMMQQFLLWSGIALLSKAAFHNITDRILLFILLGLIPPIWISSIMLWKEAWMLALLSIMIGSAFCFLKYRKNLYAIIALFSAILIVMTRQNAILFVLPVFYMCSRCVADHFYGYSKKHRRIIFVVILFLLFSNVAFVNWIVNKKGVERCHIWQYSLLWDMAAISVSANQILIPDEYIIDKKNDFLARLRSFYTPYNSDVLFYWKGAPLKVYGTPWSGCGSIPPTDKLLRKWMNTVFNHPYAYLRHRFIYLLSLLGIRDTSKDIYGNFYYRIDSEFTPANNQSIMFERMRNTDSYQKIATGILGKGWIYFLVFFLSVINLPFTADIGNRFLYMLWIAGILYFISFVAIGSGAVIRYLVPFCLLGPAIIAGRQGLISPQDNPKKKD